MKLKMNTHTKIVLLVLCFAFFNKVQAQNVGGFKKQKPFEFTGSFSIGASFYGTSKENSTRAPSSYVLNGTPTMAIYGIQIPLSFAYSDKQLSYAKPFQRYGASPYYKWVKLHLGHRNLNFSQYSLAGQTFLGAGVELTPGKFNFLAFYGKFENIFATRDPFELGGLPLETYDRKGYGVKMGYGDEKASFDLSFLKVEDQSESSGIIAIDTLGVRPKENIVISPSIHFIFFEKLSIEGTIAASVLTHNKNASAGILDDDTIDKFSSIIAVNQSTKLALAGDASANINLEKGSFGVKYQRIEPLYESLGLYGITNDFENYTINGEVSFFKKRVRVSVSQGYQKNNLTKIRQVTDLRKIGSYNVSLSLENGLNVNAQYANFQNNQEAGYVEVNDTIRLALVSKNGSISSSYRWKQKKKEQSVSLFVGAQNFKDLNPLNNLSFDNQNMNGSLNYRINMKPLYFSIRGGLTYTAHESNTRQTNRYGISIGASKKVFDERLQVKLGFSLQKSEVDKLNDGFVYRGHVGLSQQLNDKNTIALRASIIDRNSIIKEAYTDYRARFSYSFRF